MEFCCEHVLICHPSEDAQEGGRAVYLQLQRRVTSEECIWEPFDSISFKAKRVEDHQEKSLGNRSPSEGLNCMQDDQWVLDEFHFFRLGLCGTLRDV